MNMGKFSKFAIKEILFQYYFNGYARRDELRNKAR